MILEISLTKDDFLAHQLFNASRSERIRKKRRRNRYIVSILYIIIGLCFYLLDKSYPAVIFPVIGFVWIFVYPLWSRRQYRRHYAAHIDDHYSYRIGRKMNLSVEEDSLVTQDETGEGRVALSEVDGIFEIPSHFLIHLKTGVSFILPKSSLPENDLEVFVAQVESSTGVKRESFPNWKWR